MKEEEFSVKNNAIEKTESTGIIEDNKESLDLFLESKTSYTIKEINILSKYILKQKIEDEQISNSYLTKKILRDLNLSIISLLGLGKRLKFSNILIKKIISDIQVCKSWIILKINTVRMLLSKLGFSVMENEYYDGDDKVFTIEMSLMDKNAHIVGGKVVRRMNDNFKNQSPVWKLHPETMLNHYVLRTISRRVPEMSEIACLDYCEAEVELMKKKSN